MKEHYEILIAKSNIYIAEIKMQDETIAKLQKARGDKMRTLTRTIQEILLTKASLSNKQ